jgi:parallel beta-helix repeat protein
MLYLFTILFCFSFILNSQTVWVDGLNGNDSYNGGENDPYQTVTHAINSVDPGGIINIVNPGQQFHYDERVTINKERLTIQAADFNNKPIFDGSSSTTFANARAVINWSGTRENCTVNGIEIINITAHNNLMGIWVHGDGNTISNCKLSNMKRSGIVIYGNSNIIEDNIIENITGVIIGNTRLKGNNISIETYLPSICRPPCWFPSDNNIVRNNTLLDNPTHFGVNIFPHTQGEQGIMYGNQIYNNYISNTGGGIYTRYQFNMEIYNNVIVNNEYSPAVNGWGTEGSAIKFDYRDIYDYLLPIYPTGTGEFTAKVYNNVFANNEIMGIKNNTSDKLYIYNNIFYNNGINTSYSEKGNIIWAGGTFSTDYSVINNNIYYGMARWRYNSDSFIETWSAWQWAGHDANGYNAVDPQFVDVVNNNYSISPSSIAKNNGKVVPDVNFIFDKEGKPRPYWPNSIDIGAYELPDAQIKIGIQSNFQDPISFDLIAYGDYWEKDPNGFHISTNTGYGSSTVTVTAPEADKNKWNGWNYGWVNQGNNDVNKPMGHGFYKLSVDANNYFYLDLRDAVLYNPEIFISYDPDFEIFSYATGNSFIPINSSGTHDILRIWDINNNSSSNTSGLTSYWNKALILLEDNGPNPYLVWGPRINSSQYDIERRREDDEWESIQSSISYLNYNDNTLTINTTGKGYMYRIKSLYDNTFTDEVYVNADAVNKFSNSALKYSSYLSTNYPNPFNPATKINFALNHAGFVSLIIYNTLGQEIQQLINNHLEAGSHTIEFNAKSLPSGIYFYKLTAGKFSEIRKMQLLK